MLRFFHPDADGAGQTKNAEGASLSTTPASESSTAGQSTIPSGTLGVADNNLPLGGRGDQGSIFADDGYAQAQARDRIDAMWLQIAGGGQQLLNQVRAAADQALRDFASGIEGGITLTPEERADLVMATQMLAASGVLAVGASEINLQRLTQMRLDALSCLSDIAAIKAHDGEKLIVQGAARVLALAQDFVLRGVTIVATAALTG